MSYITGDHTDHISSETVSFHSSLLSSCLKLILQKTNVLALKWLPQVDLSQCLRLISI